MIGRARRIGHPACGVALVALLGLGCHGPERPITKLVGNRIVITRAVSPHAYEHATRALLYEAEGAYEKASGELQQALSYDQDSPELHARLAEVFIALSRLDDADTEVARSIAIEPTVDGLVARAHLFAARGAPDGAVVSLKEAAALAPMDDDPEQGERVYLEWANAQLMTLNLAGATATLERLRAALPQSTAAGTHLAAAFWAAGKVGEAEDGLKRVIAVEPQQLDALVLLASLQTAVGRDRLAHDALRDAFERADGNLDIATHFARWLVTHGDLAEARSLVDELGRADSDTNELPERIVLEGVVKRPERAAQLAALARRSEIEADEQARIDLAEALVLADAKRPDDALKLLLAVPEASALFRRARLQAVEILRDRGEVARARPLLEQLGHGTLDDSAAVTLATSRALVEEKTGDVARALHVLDALPAAQARTAEIVLVRAAIEERRGDWRRAVALADELLQRDPGRAEALNFAGFVAAEHDQGQKLDRALARTRAALAFEPGSAAILDSVGWVLLKQNQVAGAAEYLHQAERLSPEDAEILGHMAALYEAQGARDQAIAALERGIAREPEERVLKELKERLRRLNAKNAAGR